MLPKGGWEPKGEKREELGQNSSQKNVMLGGICALGSPCIPVAAAGQSESTQCTGGLENLSGLFLHAKGLWFGEAGHECCGISSKLAGSVGLEAGTSSTPDPPPCPEEF